MSKNINIFCIKLKELILDDIISYEYIKNTLNGDKYILLANNMPSIINNADMKIQTQYKNYCEEIKIIENMSVTLSKNADIFSDFYLDFLIKNRKIVDDYLNIQQRINEMSIDNMSEAINIMYRLEKIRIVLNLKNILDIM